MLFMISGVTSFLGRNAAKLLLERKHRVVGLVRPGSKNREKLKTPALSGLLVQELDFDSIPEAESCRRIFGFSLRGEGKEGLCLPGELIFLHFSWDGVGSAGRSDPELQERNIRNAKKAFRIAEGLHASRFLRRNTEGGDTKGPSRGANTERQSLPSGAGGWSKAPRRPSITFGSTRSMGAGITREVS